MKLLIYMRDGRTVYRIVGRGVLSKLVGAEPWHDRPGVVAERGIWNPTTGEYLFRRVWIRFLAKGSIASVEEDRDAYGEAPAAE